jgi:hypothetical protein
MAATGAQLKVVEVEGAAEAEGLAEAAGRDLSIVVAPPNT